MEAAMTTIAVLAFKAWCLAHHCVASAPDFDLLYFMRMLFNY